MINKFKIIEIDLYCHDIVVSIGQTDDELYEHIANVMSFKKFNKIFGNKKYIARTVNKKGKPVVMRFINNEAYKNTGIVAHEAFHATSYILSNVGIPFNTYTEEVYAYLIAYITNKLIE